MPYSKFSREEVENVRQTQIDQDGSFSKNDSSVMN
jgi:hypothetical protein